MKLCLLIFFCFSIGSTVKLRNDLRQKLRTASSLQDLMGKVNIMQFTPSDNKEPIPHGRLASAAALPKSRGKVHSLRVKDSRGPQGLQQSPAYSPVTDYNFMQRIRQGRDRCHLKPVCVPLPLPVHQHEIKFYPECHEVMRCVGSCCDEYNKCHPQRKRNVKRQVVHLRYWGNDRHTTMKTVNITLEEHLSCACNDCGPEAPSCDKGYVLGDWCECVCENVDDNGECIIEDELEELNQQEDLKRFVKHGKDSCSLEVVCVPVPTNNTQQNVVVFPNCFEVHRCLGSCCKFHDNCHSTASQIVQKPAAELIYLGDDNFVLNKTIMVPIEEHTACSCINCDEAPPRCSNGRRLDENCECS